MFGRGRLEKVVLKNADRSADEIAQAIFSAVSEHARTSTPSTTRPSWCSK